MRNTFKNMIRVISFAVIVISTNAQDREDNDSLVSTGMSVNSSELRTSDDAQEDSSYSGLAKVAFDQLVVQPCQGLLSTAAAFGRFSYQHPATALALTATFALPVVAALLPEQAPQLWYPQFTCAHSPDIQQVTTFVGSKTVTLNFAPANGLYNFTSNTGAPGYASATQCAYATSGYWYGPDIVTRVYTNADCAGTSYGGLPTSSTYQWGQANYTGFYSSVLAPGFSVTSWCAQAPAPTPAPAP